MCVCVCVCVRSLLITPSLLPGDLPPLILSPSQYHNYTQPRGNFIPYANEDRDQRRWVWVWFWVWVWVWVLVWVWFWVWFWEVYSGG